MQTDREFSSVVQLPDFPGASIVTRRNAAADPDQGTAETVERMQAIAVEDSTSPQVSAATHGALIGATGSTRREIAEAIYHWICGRVKFRSDDPVLCALLGLDNELDLLIRPARLLTMKRPAEDCDGFTMLCCSMLLASGVPCEIITIKADPDDPTRFSHVYCQAILEDGRALIMDCSQGAQHGFPIGWEAPEYYARKDWGVLQPMRQKGLHGLSGLGDCGDGTDPAYDSWCASGGSAPRGSDPLTGDYVVPYDSGSGGFDWANLFGSLSQTAGRIFQQQNLPPGYSMLPNGTVVPTSTLQGGGLGISSNMLLIGGGLILAVLLLGGKK